MLQEVLVPLGLIAIAIVLLGILVSEKRKDKNQAVQLSAINPHESPSASTNVPDKQETIAPKVIARATIEQGRAALEVAQLESLADQLVVICDKLSACLEKADGRSEQRHVYPLIEELTFVSGFVSNAYSAAISEAESPSFDTIQAQLKPYRFTRAA
jgi:hypothetical protein